MQSSARNRLQSGFVTAVVAAKVHHQPRWRCSAAPHPRGHADASEAVRELGTWNKGVLAVAVIKSTNVVVETPRRKLVKIRALAAGAVGLSRSAGGRGGGAAPRTTRRHHLGRAGAAHFHRARGLLAHAAPSLPSAKQFESDSTRGVTVKFSYGGSSDLAQQIVNGSPADVFAAASDRDDKTVTDSNTLTAAPPTLFATNVTRILRP